MKELKDMSMLHPMSIKELAGIPAYFPFEYNGKKLRCVPVKEKSMIPCRMCNWEKLRNVSERCPMAKACMSAFRQDHVSVKFISDELSSLNLDEEAKQKAMDADKICCKN